MSRARLLLTAFEPFGGEPVNPSWELTAPYRDDPDAVPGLHVQVVRLPVARDALPAAIDEALRRVRPHAVLAVGQATGRPAVCLEACAVNRLVYGGLSDNAGLCDVDEPLEPDGPPRLSSSLPVHELAARLHATGHPVEVSHDAGRYLCNALLYRLLHRWPALPAAFLHVPLLPEQAARRDRGEPSLPVDVTAPCLADLLADLGRRLRVPARDDA